MQDVRLGPVETVAGRPFSDLERNEMDLAAMRLMAARLREVLESGVEPAPVPWILSRSEAGRHHRIVVLNRDALLSERDLTAVGFFGQSRPDLDPAAWNELQTVDWELVEEFGRHPGVLSYSTLELPNRDYGDLALLTDSQACEHWMASAKHT